ncbi:MAG: peptidylprolyl isomerase [Marinilabiliales bacterium]|nr:MAG: peptidylprolyl isomerase [Marinilabiliales bacterium]
MNLKYTTMNNFFNNIYMRSLKRIYKHFLVLPLVLFTIISVAQEEYVVDQVVAVVGKNIILESDIETQYLSFRMQGGVSGNAKDIRCAILEDILYQKLMASEAEVDSIEVSEIQVEAELDRRLGMFINQFGSQEKMEEYYNKTLVEIKQELYEIVKDQLITQQVQSGIIEGVTVTPSEIRSFFRSLPNDSLPIIKTEYVIAEIVKNPPISVEERIRVKEQLLELRKRILQGESFSTLAILYSQDPGSAKKGGELGFYGRGQLYPEFEAVAYKLNEGEVSNVVETEAGYHIIQMIERKGDYVNVRHILLVPQVSPEDLMKARQELDTVVQLIRADSISFEEAVQLYSDADNKNSEGLLINPYTGSTSFEAEQLDAQVSFTIEKMEVGEISNPVPMKTEDQKDAYRLLLLKDKTVPHKASLEQDYTKLSEWALMDKQQKVIDKWINDKAKKTYIRIIDRYKDCAFTNEWNAR